MEGASAAVQREWLQRVEAEYRSSAITQHLTLWLTQIGASPDLILAGLQIAADEVDHATLSMEVYAAAGGAAGPRLARESLAIEAPAREPLEAAVTRLTVDVFCLGETVAVPLFRSLREGCEVEVARRALDRILRDEVRHRDFGWSALGWLLETPYAASARGLIERELPGWFSRLWASYAPREARGRDTLDADDRRWGLMAPGAYQAVLARCFERDYLPRFEALGLDPRPAWREAMTRAGLV